MNELTENIFNCIKAGKVDVTSSFPPDMRGKNGAFEYAKTALEQGIAPNDILEKALIPAMDIVGTRFAKKEIFVPQMLLSAKAMSAAMSHLKPYFKSGESKLKGRLIIGTVSGDLHDIGKNLVAMMVEGSGWEIIDLGVDVDAEKFMKAIDQYPDSAIGLSALLTTTMENMKRIVEVIRKNYPENKLLVGGAPVTMDYCKSIGADYYSPDPQGAVKYLNTLIK